MNKLAFTASAVLAVSTLWAIPGTIRTSQGAKSGDISWQSRSKSYALTSKNATIEFKLEDVTDLDIEKPKDFDRAVQLVKEGKGASAIDILEKIVRAYKMLVWDRPAARYLVEAHLAAGQAADAEKAARLIINEDREAAYKGELAPLYWQVLLKLGKSTQLENCLRLAVESGDRAAGAEALVMRGDMILAAGPEGPDTYRKALTDSYLRVVLMYTDAPCKPARASAMSRAATCFDKLGMAARAENLRTQANNL